MTTFLGELKVTLISQSQGQCAKMCGLHGNLHCVAIKDTTPELSMGWVDPWVGLGWLGSGWVEILQLLVGWVGLGPR